MSANSLTTTAPKSRATACQWVRFFSIRRLEAFYIGRNLYLKTGFASARRNSNSQRVNVSPLSRFRTARPYVAKKN